jgi:hypothetical protein
MIGLLENIIEIFENIPAYILYSIETFVNAFFALINVVIEGILLVLPGLPEIYHPPKYLAEVNWYYPAVTLIAYATPFFTAYIAWLGVSSLYRKFGAIA